MPRSLLPKGYAKAVDRNCYILVNVKQFRFTALALKHKFYFKTINYSKRNNY